MEVASMEHKDDQMSFDKQVTVDLLASSTVSSPV